MLGGERLPLGARAGRRRSPRPRGGRPSRALELALDQVLAPDAHAPVAPELRLQRAERDLAVGAGVGPVADDPAGRAAARRAAGTAPSQRYWPATIASHDSAPSAIETSTNWPSPERSRSRSAARIPNAAISAPPPRSAIWPAAWIGGPSASPVRPSRPMQPEVVHVVAGAVAQRAVLAVAGDRAVDDAAG